MPNTDHFDDFSASAHKPEPDRGARTEDGTPRVGAGRSMTVDDFQRAINTVWTTYGTVGWAVDAPAEFKWATPENYYIPKISNNYYGLGIAEWKGSWGSVVNAQKCAGCDTWATVTRICPTRIQCTRCDHIQVTPFEAPQ